MPETTRAGREIHRSGLLRRMSEGGAPAAEMVRTLDEEIASVV